MSKLQFEELSNEAVSVGNVIWKIADFYNIVEKTSDFLIDSSTFSAAGASWCLQIYPNKKKHSKRKSLSCIDIRIVRLRSCFPQHSVSFSFQVQDFNGKCDTKQQCYTGNMVITGNGESLELNSSFSCYQKDNETASLLSPDNSLTLLGTLHIKRSLQSIDGSSKENNFEGPKKLIHDLKKLLLSESSSDITIKVKGRKFPAHSAIIGVRSPVFAAMLRTEMKEKQSGIVDIEDLDPDVFPVFLSYLYTESLNELSAENVFSLFMTADKYDVVDLKSVCVQFMKSCLSVDTFCNVVTISLRHGEKELLKEATDYFSSHLKEIIDTVQWQIFLKENPTQGNELIIKALSSWQKI